MSLKALTRSFSCWVFREKSDERVSSDESSARTSHTEAQQQEATRSRVRALTMVLKAKQEGLFSSADGQKWKVCWGCRYVWRVWMCPAQRSPLFIGAEALLTSASLWNIHGHFWHEWPLYLTAGRDVTGRCQGWLKVDLHFRKHIWWSNLAAGWGSNSFCFCFTLHYSGLWPVVYKLSVFSWMFLHLTH